MNLGFFYIDTFYIYLVVPAIFLAGIASMNVQSTFNKYNKIGSGRGYTGAKVARLILDAYGLRDVTVEETRGKLSDHFDPRTKVIRLSTDVYSGKSVASIGVAAHEVGHAIQYSQKYFPIVVRNKIIPITQIGSTLSMPLILFGYFSGDARLIQVGILLFSTVAFFQLVTLPVEFNASTRAISTIQEYGILDDDEALGAKKVLNAAALTYVAALVVSIANILRLILVFGNRSND
ncbi:MAG: zinc metallopeptidase [Oscillospiraceae bacterium]